MNRRRIAWVIALVLVVLGFLPFLIAMQGGNDARTELVGLMGILTAPLSLLGLLMMLVLSVMALIDRLRR